MRLKTKLLSFILILLAIYLRADDGAASIAAGGIVVMQKEPRITMAKEVLQISITKVIVDYDFRNDSDESISTTVAFPIPDYEVDDHYGPAAQGFDDFRLSVDGSPARYSTDVRAVVKDTDYTDLLNRLRVDIPTFGESRGLDDYPEIARLTPSQHKQLESLGLIYPGSDNALWHVRKKYYWQQTFPAHKMVHIHHEYTPVLGSSNSILYGMGPHPDREAAEEMGSFCIDGPLQTTLTHIAGAKDKDAWYSYVDFILTTANTWKTPIEDFTLIVERPHRQNNRGEHYLADYVSFCWEGPVTKTDSDHFSAHASNFVPTKELRIGFFSVEASSFSK